MSDDPRPKIYDEMVDLARRAGTAAPGGLRYGQEPALTQVPTPYRRQPGGRVTYAGHVDWSGENDDLVTATWNGLRPADASLPQPPQDPDWTPDADR
jgi:hypothetical protein